MTTPQDGYPPAYDPYQPPISGQPYPPTQPYGAPVPYQPYSPYPTGGYAVDPMTGQALSDKSKVIAGLLQLLPGFLLGLGGIGRLYAGHVSIGVAQLVATMIGWISFWCGFVLFVPFFIFVGVWLWFVIDGIMLLAGRPTDGQGRLLRA